MKRCIVFLALLVFCTGAFVYAGQYEDVSVEYLVNKCSEKVVDMLPLEAIYCDSEGVFVYADQKGSLIQCGTCWRYYDPDKRRPCPK